MQPQLLNKNKGTRLVCGAQTRNGGKCKNRVLQPETLCFRHATRHPSESIAQYRDGDDALSLKNEALGHRAVRQAEELGREENYPVAIQVLNSALEVLPEDAEAQQLLADFEKRQQEQTEQQSEKRLKRPQELFDATLAKVKDADLFESHELKTNRKADEVRSAIVKQLQKVSPTFQLIHSDIPLPGIFRMEAKEEFFGGLRSCLIVIGQTKDDETTILFKVLEYKTHHGVTMQGLNVLETTEHIPVHPSRIPEMTDRLKAQVEEGTKMLTERIQRAVGEL